MVTMYKSVLLALSVIGPVYSLLITETERTNLSQPLNNLLFHDDKFYVGGRNNIYVLNKNLGVLEEVSTCNNSLAKCNNLNTLLLIKDDGDNRGNLINCGTGYNGICQVRNLSKIKDSSSVNDTTLVSSDINRPVQGMITKDGKLMLAVTFGEGIPNSDPNNTYRYAICKRIVKTLLVADSQGTEPRMSLETNGNYIIYYKSSFKSDKYSYFTTIQKESMQESNYTSKLVRLCQNDNLFSSYVDMPINCESRGVAYKLLQTAVVADTQSGKVFIGAFTRGNDPEKPENLSVICIEKLSSLDIGLNESLKTFVLSNITEGDPKRYLKDNRKNPVKEENYVPQDFSCGEVDIKYAIGTETRNLQAAYSINEENGYVSTLDATKLEGHNVVLAGTSKGYLHQFNLEIESEIFSLTLFDNQTIDKDSEIRGIKEDGNFTMYVMSSSKLFKLKSSRCSEFKTCQETMAKKNPHCGWCVFEYRASRQESCKTLEWIHSYQKCIKLNTSISGISVGTEGKMKSLTWKTSIFRE